LFFSGDIFKEKLSRMLDVNTTKHSSTASTVTATSTTANTEVVDVFDDPLNASDV